MLTMLGAYFINLNLYHAWHAALITALVTCSSPTSQPLLRLHLCLLSGLCVCYSYSSDRSMASNGDLQSAPRRSMWVLEHLESFRRVSVLPEYW